MKLDPTGSLAMKESRYPVTEMGLLQLADLVLQVPQARPVTRNRGSAGRSFRIRSSSTTSATAGSSNTTAADVETTTASRSPTSTGRCSLPICVKNFGWPAEGVDVADATALDEATFIEYYGYTDIQFEDRLSDNDFDKKNADYKFRR